VEKPITVLIADDHPFLRAGMRVLLEKRGEFRVVGEAGDGLEAVQKALDLAPDVLLLDIQMPHLDGLQVLDALREREAQVQVIILSAFDDKCFAQEALARGARGYYLKEEAPALLAEAIRNSMEESRSGASSRVEL